MDEVARLVTLLALLGGATTLAGGVCIWFLDEARRIRRTLTQALGAIPQPMLIARGRGVGLGFDLSRKLVAVTWDRGGWQLTYRLDEMIGAELIVDRQVVARAFRGEPRRGLDQLADPQERVRFRILFDDAGHPDFEIDLWRPEDDGRRGRLYADEALHEANRWMARVEALLRRPVARPASPAPRPAAPVSPPPQDGLRQPAGPLFGDDTFEDDAEDTIN